MQSLPQLAQDSFFAALSNYKSEMKETNTDALKDGEYIDSSLIKPEYAESTKRIKQRKGQRFDVVTLRDKGDFHRSIRYDVLDDSVLITATDPKTEMLNRKYRKPETREIYGMQPKRYNEGVYPLAVKLANYELFKSITSLNG